MESAEPSQADIMKRWAARSFAPGAQADIKRAEMAEEQVRRDQAPQRMAETPRREFPPSLRRSTEGLSPRPRGRAGLGTLVRKITG